MQAINDRYSNIIEHDVVAMKAIIRANVRAVNFGRLAWQMTAETDMAKRRSLDEETAGIRKEFDDFMKIVAEKEPVMAEEIRLVELQFEALVTAYANARRELFANNQIEAIRLMGIFVAKRKELSESLVTATDNL